GECLEVLALPPARIPGQEREDLPGTRRAQQPRQLDVAPADDRQVDGVVELPGDQRQPVVAGADRSRPVVADEAPRPGHVAQPQLFALVLPAVVPRRECRPEAQAYRGRLDEEPVVAL